MKNKFSSNIWSKALFAAALFITALPVSAALNKFEPLTYQEQIKYGWTHRGVFDATNFTATVTPLFPVTSVGTENFPAGTQIERVAAKLIYAVQSANATGTVEVALSIGDFSITNRYLSGMAVGTNIGTGVLSTNLFTGTSGFNVASTAVWNGGTTNHWRQIYSMATNLNVILTYGIAGTDGTTGGSGRFEVYLKATALNDASDR